MKVMKERQFHISLMAMMVLFTVIACICVYLLFSPVTIHTRIGGEEYAMAPRALSIEGMSLRVDAWKEYPTYNIGIGIIGGLAAFGIIFMSRCLYLVEEGEDTGEEGVNDAL